MQTIYLDISNKSHLPTINAKQGDVGRKFAAVVTDAGIPYSIPNNSSVSLWYETLKNNNAGNFDGVVVNGNRMEITIDPALTQVSGEGILCLTIIYNNGNEISTWNIPYNVEEKPGANPVVPDKPGINMKSVLYVPQNLTPNQKAQARKNIDAELDAPDYYHTEREELGVSHEYINEHGADYVYSLYDALMAQYPDYVEKTSLTANDGSEVGHEYVISAGKRTDGVYTQIYEDDKQPKFLVLSGIHGDERKPVFSTYRFIKDLLKGHNVPQSFGAEIHVLPIGSPSAFEAFTRENSNGVDINRNFNSAEPDKETQAIQNWLNANSDSDLFIDFHNSWATNEVVSILGDSSNDATDLAKKIAIQGVDRVVPFWRDVIGYPPVEVPYPEGNEAVMGERDVIFSYSASISEDGTSVDYAQNTVGIPSITIETATYYGDYSEWLDNTTAYQPEVIAAGAEALGNILIELFSEASEVKYMAGVKESLDRISQSVNSGFHAVSGKMVLSADMLPTSGSAITVKIPCPNGAKTVDFHADSDTLTSIKASSGVRYLGAYLGNFYAPNVTNVTGEPISYASMMTYNESQDGWYLLDGSVMTQSNTDGVTFSAYALKGGEVSTAKLATYEWTAYYWNEGDATPAWTGGSY